MRAPQHSAYGIRVTEVMQERFLMVDGMNTIRDVLMILRTEPAHSMVVYKRHDADEYGILLVDDIGRKVLATGRRPDRINVYEVMAKPAVTVPATMGVIDCARLLTRGDISRAPVVDGQGEIVGTVSLHDLVLRGVLPRLEDATTDSGHGEPTSVTAQQDEQERPQEHPDG